MRVGCGNIFGFKKNLRCADFQTLIEERDLSEAKIWVLLFAVEN